MPDLAGHVPSTPEPLSLTPPTIGEIAALRSRIAPWVDQTPIFRWCDPIADRRLGRQDLVLKLELLQRTGSFKPRGALAVMLDLPATQLARGIVAVSAGNHGIAVAYAAQQLSAQVTVVMPRTANPARVEMCIAYGARVVLVDHVAAAFERAHELVAREGLTFVHPFEGPATALGTATVGLEFGQQAGPMDVVLVPVGGGGLAAGIACALKQLYPGIRIVGVEPAGADSMTRSFAAGKPMGIEAVRTIADSLGSPSAAPYSFELCRRYVDEIVLVDDDELREGMVFLQRHAKLAVEPAGAACLAALLGPLHPDADGTRGQVPRADARIGLVICGANIDTESYARALLAGLAGTRGTPAA